MRFLIFTVLIACGTEDPNSNSGTNSPIGSTNTSAKTDSETEANPAAEPQEVAANSQPADVFAIAVADSANLPACSSDNELQLAFVRAKQVFVSCERGEWAVVTIVAAKGDNGQPGEQGPAGQDGQDGAQGLPGIGISGQNGQDGVDGINGTNGLNGQDGQPVTGNAWADPITSRQWLLGSLSSPEAAATACSNGWSLPTVSEASAAILHGLLTVDAAVIESVWTSELGPTSLPWFVSSGGTFREGEYPGYLTYSPGVVCIKEST